MTTFWALLNCMQFTNAHIMAIIEEGIMAPEDLYMSKQCFQLLWFWVKKRTSFVLPILPQLLTQEQKTLWGERMKASIDILDSQRPTINPPTPYEKDTKRRIWKEQLMTYIESKIGQFNAPLTFVREWWSWGPSCQDAVLFCHWQLLDEGITSLMFIKLIAKIMSNSVHISYQR